MSLVAGGGSGLGRAIASGLAEAGARVSVTDKFAEEAEQTLEMIQRKGGKGRADKMDVTNRSEFHWSFH